MLVRFSSEVLAYIEITHHQYNAAFFQKNINKQGKPASVAELFDDPVIVKNVQLDLDVADAMHAQIVQLENTMYAKAFDPRT